MQRLILHHFYRASIRKACIHMLSTGCGEKNDVKLTAVCIRRPLCIFSAKPEYKIVHSRTSPFLDTFQVAITFVYRYRSGSHRQVAGSGYRKNRGLSRFPHMPASHSYIVRLIHTAGSFASIFFTVPVRGSEA